MASDTGTVWSVSVSWVAKTIDGLALLIEGILTARGKRLRL